MTVNKKNKSKLSRISNLNFFFFNKIKRIISYYWLRLARLPGSTYAISAGFACGSMVSFTPLLGLHFFLAVMFAFLIRGNFIASLLGTAIGNPITFPFIWGLIYNIGAFLTSKSSVDFESNISIDLIVNETYEVFIPMLIGGGIIALPVWLLTYFTVYSLITSYKRTKNKIK